jgi:MFS family permease
MVQVDVFWSYGIGAGFALAAANQLRKREPGPDPYLATTVIYAAAVFAPSGAWLLWQFTSWETMHAGTYASVPGWLVALFTATNTTQAIVGYLVTRWLLRRDRLRLACLQLVAAYFAMFFVLVHGWDGTGYQRFFSATAADFAAWDPDRVWSWFGSDVALTLYGMGFVLIPLLFGIAVRWHVAARGTGTGARFVALLLAGILGLGLGGAVIASLLVHALGWIGGAAAFALLAALVVAPPRGPVAWAAHHLTPLGAVS